LQEGDSRIFEFRCKVGCLLVKVKAESEKGEQGLIHTRNRFNKNAGELAILEEKIVGPLQCGLELSQGANRICGGEGGEERKKRKLRRGDFQKNGDPKSKWVFRQPRFSGSSVASGLDLGSEDCRCRWKLSAENLLRRGAGFKDRRAAVEGGFRRKKEVDVSGLERIGQGGGFRERNCRRS
jgi:hypothetical protein